MEIFVDMANGFIRGQCQSKELALPMQSGWQQCMCSVRRGYYSNVRIVICIPCAVSICSAPGPLQTAL
jgi:hypothetical protein